MAVEQAANTEYQIIKCVAQVHLSQTNWIIWSHYLTNNAGVGIMFLKTVWAGVHVFGSVIAC